MEFILILLLALLFAAFGTIVGFGGGIFMIPILVIGFNLPINVAVGSVILALFPGSLVSSYFNHKRKKIDYRAGITLEIPTVIGTILGAYLTSVLALNVLEIVFAVFVTIVGFSMFRKTSTDTSEDNRLGIFKKLNKLNPAITRTTKDIQYRMSYLLTGTFGSLAGIISGLFGIGGGFLKTPIMVNVFNIPPSVAAATAIFMIVFTSLTGSISHFYLGHLDFYYSIPIVIGFILGAFLGNHLNLKLSEKTLKKLIGIGLFTAGFSILLNIIL